MLPVGCKIFKNAQIILTAEGVYNKQSYKVSASLQLLPVIHDELCTIKLSDDIINVSRLNEYSPMTLTALITRKHAGNITEFKSYKQYHITYAYSDDINSEIEYDPEKDVIAFRDLNLSNRYPEYMLFNLYKTQLDNIPLQTLKLKFKRQGFKESNRCFIELSKTYDNVLVSQDYHVVDDVVILTNCKFNLGNNTYANILINDNYNIDINLKTLKTEDESLLDGLSIIPELLNDGSLNL